MNPFRRVRARASVASSDRSLLAPGSSPPTAFRPYAGRGVWWGRYPVTVAGPSRIRTGFLRCRSSAIFPTGSGSVNATTA
jgi:hypothetical protein